jgi:hypothetical protein
MAKNLTGWKACLWSHMVGRAISLVIPTEPSASGRRGINAERLVWMAEEKESRSEDAIVEKFIARYGSAVAAVLGGFDRLVYRGHPLANDSVLVRRRLREYRKGAGRESATHRIKSASC